MILIDTNIIIYSKQLDSEFHSEVTQRLTQLNEEGNLLAVCPQVIYEFYRFATSPESNNRGFGMSPNEALSEVENIIDAYELIEENNTMFYWKNVMREYEVRGKNSHDARIVATMKANNLEKIYTKNTADFNRFNNIIQLV